MYFWWDEKKLADALCLSFNTECFMDLVKIGYGGWVLGSREFTASKSDDCFKSGQK